MPKPCPALRKPCSLQRAGFSSLRVWQDGGRVNLAQGRTRGDRPKGGSHGARVHRCVSGQRNNSGTSGGAGLSFCDERALGARPHQWPVGKRVQAVHDVPTSAFRLILSVGTRALPAAISACGQMQIWGTADIGARYRASDASEGRSEGAWRGGALPNAWCTPLAHRHADNADKEGSVESGFSVPPHSAAATGTCGAQGESEYSNFWLFAFVSTAGRPEGRRPETPCLGQDPGSLLGSRAARAVGRIPTLHTGHVFGSLGCSTRFS